MSIRFLFYFIQQLMTSALGVLERHSFAVKSDSGTGLKVWLRNIV